MQRFLYHFKCDKLSKQKSINRTCDEVVLLWQKVADGSTPGYTCYLSVNSIKTRINTLWEEYRTTQAWGKRSSEEQSKTSKNFKEKLKSLFDIAKWILSLDCVKTIGNLCRIKEWNKSRRLVTGTPNYWLVWSERRYAKKTTRDGRTRQRRRKRCSQWFWG